jgi:hypothetical protein
LADAVLTLAEDSGIGRRAFLGGLITLGSSGVATLVLDGRRGRRPPGAGEAPGHARTARAGDLADRHRLRRFDALHLASYLVVAREFPEEDVVFSSADHALERAARRAHPRRRSGRGKRRP